MFVHIRGYNRGAMWRTLAILVLSPFIACVYNAPSLSAQIIEMREYRGKQITQSRDAAVIIELGQAEKRTNVDFRLPNGIVP